MILNKIQKVALNKKMAQGFSKKQKNEKIKKLSNKLKQTTNQNQRSFYFDDYNHHFDNSEKK